MIPTLNFAAPNAATNRVLLIMLPGIGFGGAAFLEHGMVAAAQAHGQAVDLAIDIVAAQPGLELYLDGGIAAALHDSVVAPALARGYTRIWLLGISLGGMGALLYARAYPIEGLVLLAPFLGTKGTVEEIRKAGALTSWSSARSIATDQEKNLLLWLQDYLARRPALPALYLGYGREDRFAPGHTLLAQQLPETKVVTATGGHDWDTWLTLWNAVLEAITGRCQAPRIS